MKFGLGYFPTDEGVDPPTLARLAEERGFESLLFTDHTHIPAGRETRYPAGGELPQGDDADAERRLDLLAREIAAYEARS